MLCVYVRCGVCTPTTMCSLRHTRITHPSSGALYALKLIAMDDEVVFRMGSAQGKRLTPAAVRKLLIDEGRVLSKLDHAHIVRYV